MSTPNTSFNDGKFLRAGRLITINTLAYIASDVKITDGTREKLVYDDTDKPAGGFQTSDYGKISLTLTGLTTNPRPNRHDVFVYDAANSRTWVIGSVDESSSDNNVTSWAVTGREVINPLTATAS